MRLFDRICACVLILAASLHGVGSYLGYHNQPMTFLWALSASFLGILTGAINLLRAARMTDRPLARICFVANLVLCANALAFGWLVGNVFDPRAMMHGLAALALAAFSFKPAFASVVAK